jgi:hypothetical protein
LEIPVEFQWLAFNSSFAFDKETTSDEEFIALVLERLDSAERRALLKFLSVILDGGYDDRQIEEFWSKTDTDLIFLQPGDTRRYLTVVRDELAKESAAESR